MKELTSLKRLSEGLGKDELIRLIEKAIKQTPTKGLTYSAAVTAIAKAAQELDSNNYLTDLEETKKYVRTLFDREDLEEAVQELGNFGILVEGVLWARFGAPVSFNSRTAANRAIAVRESFEGLDCQVVELTENEKLRSLGKDIKTSKDEPGISDDEVDAALNDKGDDADSTVTSKKDDSTEEKPEFKVGDKVIPKVGPHKGEVHTIVKVHVNGELDITPDGLEGDQIKYPSGVGGHAKPEQVDLSESKKFDSSFLKMFEAAKLAEGKKIRDFDEWKDAVKKAYPDKKLKFKGRVEGGKSLISAEQAGEDRCYGVWDSDKDVGEVLGEGCETRSMFENEVIKPEKEGWYVCDYKERPIHGPMSQTKAEILADQLSTERRPCSAEYFSDYQIRRMNESKQLRKEVRKDGKIIGKFLAKFKDDQGIDTVRYQANPKDPRSVKTIAAKEVTVIETPFLEDTSGDYGIYRKHTYIAKKTTNIFKKGDEVYVTSAMYAPDYRVFINDDGTFEADVDDISVTYDDLKAAGIVGKK